MADPTFHLRHYPFGKLVIECIKCQRVGRFDKAQLIEKLGETYPVHGAVKRLTQDWECEKPNAIPAYALHPRAMYCMPHLPEWQARVAQFFLDAKYQRPRDPLYAAPVTKA